MFDTSIPQPAVPMLAYTSNAGEALLPIAANAHLLQQAADYRRGIRLLAASGKSDLIWGALLLGLGCLLYRVHYFATSLFILGGLLLAVGIWLKIKPNPAAMLADATMLLLLAGVNAWRYLYELSHPRAIGPHQHGIYIFVFVICVLSALMRFRRYKSFAAASASPPSRETIQWLDEMHRMLKLTSAAASDTMVRFDSTTFPPMSFKAQLLPDLAVCLVNQSQLRFVPKSAIELKPIARSGKKIKAQARLGERSATGLITPALLERFTQWKNEEEPTVLELDEG
jgi:hypothetical protein